MNGFANAFIDAENEGYVDSMDSIMKAAENTYDPDFKGDLPSAGNTYRRRLKLANKSRNPFS